MSTGREFSTPATFEVRDLTVQLANDEPLCQSLSFALQAGDCLAILGRNGAGKTTLLHQLSGITPTQRGSVWVNAHNLHQQTPRQQAQWRGLLPQQVSGGMSEGLDCSVLEAALTGRHPFINRWQQENEADYQLGHAALTEVGLQGLESRRVNTLSGGERQRLNLATLFVQNAPIMLLDEPLAHLDLHHQIAVLESLQRRAQQGHIVIMVLHDPALACRYCSHTLLLYGNDEISNVGIGNAEFGPISLVDAARLSQLYGHPIQEIRSATNARVFIPD